MFVASNIDFFGSPFIEGRERFVGRKCENYGGIATQDKKQARAFLGLTGYYREFIPKYAEITGPLVDLTKRGQPTRVKWQEDHQLAFDSLFK